MGELRSPKFWWDAAERALKTFAQTAAALLTAFVASGAGIEMVNWLMVASVSGVAAIYSVLMSVGSSNVGNSDSASLVKGK